MAADAAQLNLPPDFVRNILQAFPAEGARWLASLPDLLAESARAWDLSLGEPFLLSYNYVCAATLADGTPAVFKLGVPNRELTSEINALRLYAGEGACRLLRADPEKGRLLLERLLPGNMLLTLDDDDRETGIAADVMLRIRRPAPQQEGFLSLRGWFDELKGLRTRFGGGTGPFPPRLVERVEARLPELFTASGPDVLLHGDFHHFNILSSERGWLVIDPKGVVGPAGYEVGPLLTNPIGAMPEPDAAIRRTRRRLGILSERLGADPEHLLDWAACHCLLSAYWDVGPDGSGGEYGLAWAQIFLKMWEEKGRTRRSARKTTS